MFTPGAQCPGPAEYQYAVLPFEGDFLEAGVRAESRRYRVPPVTVQGVREGSVAGGGSLLAQEVGAATVTAMKRHRCRPTLLVRLYNPHGVAIQEILSSQLSIDGAWRTDLLEEREGELAVTGNRLKVSLGPGEIASLELQLSVSGR